jgi:general secretion pathway protein M
VTGGSLTLPEGRAGQALAIALPLLAVALLWFAVLSPLFGWYESRAADLAQSQEIAAHMAALGQEIPALRKTADAAIRQSAGDPVLLDGGTDVMAGADLQTALQNLATQAGTSLDSAEALPVQQSGALRRISIQVSVTASWPVLIALLEAIDTARPRMIVEQLGIVSTGTPGTDPAPPVQANFSVIGFRAGSP